MQQFVSDPISLTRMERIACAAQSAVRSEH
jgi:hypothetical protein